MRFSSDATIYGSDYGNTPGGDVTATAGVWDGFPFKGTLTLGPASVVILSQ